MKSIFSKLRSRLRKSRRRRDRARWDSAEILESRQLLTLGFNFEFTAIASNLSETERFFGSSTDAPFEVIRYGEGTLTSFQDFDIEPSRLDPADISFRFGSMDATNPVEVVTLSSFDDGQSDGTANQVYRPDANDNAEVLFFYKGGLIGYGALDELALETTPDGTVTSSSSKIRLLHTRPPGFYDPLGRDVFETFRAAAPTQGSVNSVLEFDLSPFQLDGSWAGVVDAEIFSSTGHVDLPDDLPDKRALAPVVDVSTGNPITGETHRDYDNDIVRVHLNPALTYTFDITSTGTSSVGIFDNDNVHTVPSVQHASSSTGPAVIQGSSSLDLVFQSAPAGGTLVSYSLSIVELAPKTFWTSVDNTGEFPVASWSLATQSNGNPAPADSYVVTLHEKVEVNFSGGGEVFRESVAGNVQQHTLSRQASLGFNYIRVGRVVDGTVVQWSNGAEFSNDIRTTIAPVTSNSITWDAILGARSYDVHIDNLSTGQTGVIRTNGHGGNAFTLPEDFALGSYRVYVRGKSFAGLPGGWSLPRNFTSRTAVVLNEIEPSARPTITWNALPGAVEYELYIRNVTTGATVFNDASLTGTSYTPDADLPLGRYRVWVRGIGADGRAGAWSVFAAFGVAPQAAGTTFGNNLLRPTFEWTTPAGTQSVDLYIRNGSNVIEQNGLTGNSWTPPSDLVGTKTTWWVRGTASTGAKTPWSAPEVIGLDRSIITSVEETSGGRQQITWTAMPNAVSYTVWVSQIGVGNVVNTTGVTDTTFETASLSGGAYRVWVQSVDGGGNGIWSRRFDFNIPVPRGSAPVITSPLNTTASNTPTITWAPVQNASNYVIWISLRHDRRVQLINPIDPAQTSYTVSTPLAPGNYILWVGEGSIVSDQPIWSRPWLFTVS